MRSIILIVGTVGSCCFGILDMADVDPLTWQLKIIWFPVVKVDVGPRTLYQRVMVVMCVRQI